MDKNEVQRRVIKVVCDVLNVEADIVTPEANFTFDLGAESTQSVQLVAALEEEFGVEMDSDAALAVESVGGAVEFIAQLIDGDS
jgi:acyl carrier protein